MGELELFEEKGQVLWRVDAKEAQKHLLSWKMLEHNEIPGFLPFDYYYVDNEIQFRYHYFPLERLDVYFKRKDGDFETIRFICEEVLRILEKGQEYLLDLEGCMLLPEWIFWNKGEKKIRICFLTGKEGNIRAEYTTLVEYLMQHAKHSDEKLVAMIYGLYDRAVSDSFLPEQLRQYLQEYSGQREGETENLRKGRCIEEKATNRKQERPKKNSKKENMTKKAVNFTKGYFLELILGNENGRLAKNLAGGPDRRLYLIETGEFVVGREEKSDFCIPFTEVSRRHALLIKEEEGVFVMDADSRNGTCLNNNKISAYVKTSCKENDIITFADISYKVRRN